MAGEKNKIVTCPSCNGSGVMRWTEILVLNGKETKVRAQGDCTTCNGAGGIAKE